MIIVTGSFVARPESLDEARAVCLEHVHRSRLEPGCLSHAFHQDGEHPRRFFFFEEWADSESLDAHFQVPACRAFVQAVGALAEGPPQIQIYSAQRLR